MKPSPLLRKLTLTAHVTVSIGWLGALLVFLVHGLIGWTSHDDLVIRATALAMGLTAWMVILPLSIASVITGLIQALTTAWGLLRHYWVVAKLTLTIVATIVLLLKLGPISFLAETASNPSLSMEDQAGLRISMIVHAAGGVLFLLAAVVLAIYKPAGVIRSRSGNHQSTTDSRSPRWVKVFALVALAIVFVLFGMLVVVGHGPGAHLQR